MPESPDNGVETTPTMVGAPSLPRYQNVDSPGWFTTRACEPHATTNGRGRSSVTGVVLLDERAPQARTQTPSRRPLVAVIDTVIEPHPWLGDGTCDDPFWRVATREGGSWLGPSQHRTDPRSLASLPFEELPRHFGHGTFIAGIIRQLAPDARILSIPVMDDDGKAETGRVLEALQWLRDRVVEAREHEDPALFVDVINLALGWRASEEEHFAPLPDRDEYVKVLGELGDAGVRVVVSAGNQGREEPVDTAAIAKDQQDAETPPRTPMLSVGALDPDGRRATYSNHGNWVLLYAPGTGLISTMPRVQGLSLVTPADMSSGVPNPDHLARGFARWNGTSFAAAWVSGKIAAHLLDGPYAWELHRLDCDQTHLRAEDALNATKADIDRWRGATDAPG